MNKAFFPLVCLCLVPVAGLTACAGPTVIDQGPRERQIDSLYDYGAADRDLKLEVQGNGFPGRMSGADFARLVEAGVQGPLPRAQTHPLLNPGPTARENYRLVFLFNPAPTMMGQSLCDGRADQQRAVAGEVRLVAAFCVSGRAETEVAAWTPAAGPGDSDFQFLLNQTMLTLFRPDLREGSHFSPRIP